MPPPSSDRIRMPTLLPWKKMRLPSRKAKWLARLEEGSCLRHPATKEGYDIIMVGTYLPTYTKVRLWEG